MIEQGLNSNKPYFQLQTQPPNIGFQPEPINYEQLNGYRTTPIERAASTQLQG